jgi:hypothetical protein
LFIGFADWEIFEIFPVKIFGLFSRLTSILSQIFKLSFIFSGTCNFIFIFELLANSKIGIQALITCHSSAILFVIIQEKGAIIFQLFIITEL